MKKLLIGIDNSIQKFPDLNIECLVVNDASTIAKPVLIKPKKIKSLKIPNIEKIEVTQDVMHLGLDMDYNEEFDHLI